jgi:type IX secretion system PorP/SprF family membrane protein
MTTVGRNPFIAISFCLAALNAGAQDIHFSQFHEMPLLRNPALAGIYRGDVRMTSAHRSQWGSVTVPYQTQALGFETKFAVSRHVDDFLTLGIQLTNDIAGDSRLGRFQALPVVGFHKILDELRSGYLTLAFMGGPVQQRFDPTRLRFDDQFVNGAYSSLNPTQQAFSQTNLTYWDPSVGLSWSQIVGADVRFYAGACYFHFLKPRVAFSPQNDVRLNPKLMVNAGMNSPLSEFDRLILYLDVFSQGGNRQAQGGVLLTHSFLEVDEDYGISLSAGAFYRWNDAVVPVLKLDMYSFGLGLSYDANTSKLRTASTFRGGLEATLSFRSFLQIRNGSLQRTQCPISF